LPPKSKISYDFLAYFAHEKLEIVLSAPVPAYLSGRRGGQKGVWKFVSNV